MPELPEVEFAARALERAARGNRISRLVVSHPALARRLPPRDAARLRGREVLRVERRGKHQLVHLSGGVVLHAHFRMSGDWHIGRSNEPAPRYARAVLEFDDGLRATLVDPRALSTLMIREGANASSLDLGPEATDPDFDASTFASALAAKRGSIKAALLDQRVLAGLGNIYAAESLWRARIDPRAPASALDRRRLDRLLRAIRETLAAAGRAPARYSEDASDARFSVYGRAGSPCRRCARTIERIVQGGRSTYYCPSCQRA